MYACHVPYMTSQYETNLSSARQYQIISEFSSDIFYLFLFWFELFSSCEASLWHWYIININFATWSYIQEFLPLKSFSLPGISRSLALALPAILHKITEITCCYKRANSILHHMHTLFFNFLEYGTSIFHRALPIYLSEDLKRPQRQMRFH